MALKYTLLNEDKTSKARLGKIETPHGEIETQLAAPLKGLMPAPCRLLPPLIPHLSILIQW